jgi:hypothetical protein
MSSLLSIVKSGRIWATHCRFLNDRSEITTMWNAVEKRLEERLGQEKSSAASDLSAVAEAVKNRRSSNEFVVSFSENGDDLSQWRSYCPSGGGVSLGFSNEALESRWVADPEGGESSWVGGSLMKVRYLDESNYAAALDPVIGKALKVAAELDGQQGFFGTTHYKDIARAVLSLLAPSYKHEAFRHECEWRLVVTKPHKPMPGQRSRPGKSTLIPYVEVDLNRNLKFELSEKYMLRKVIVGPTPSPELAVEALLGLFAVIGQKVDVEPSSIPFRNW